MNIVHAWVDEQCSIETLGHASTVAHGNDKVVETGATWYQEVPPAVMLAVIGSATTLLIVVLVVVVVVVTTARYDWR